MPAHQPSQPTAIRGVDDPIELLGLDIETDTSIDGLDPQVAAIVAIALVGSDSTWHFEGDEGSMLTALDSVVATLGRSVLVTWNGARFDLPFIAARASRLGIPLGLELQERQRTSRHHADDVSPAFKASWWACSHLDGYRLYRNDTSRVLQSSCGLKAMARIVGLDPIEVDRERLHQLDADQVAAYVRSDARIARELVLRRFPSALRFVDTMTRRPAPTIGR